MCRGSDQDKVFAACGGARKLRRLRRRAPQARWEAGKLGRWDAGKLCAYGALARTRSAGCA